MGQEPPTRVPQPAGRCGDHPVVLPEQRSSSGGRCDLAFQQLQRFLPPEAVRSTARLRWVRLVRPDQYAHLAELVQASAVCRVGGHGRVHVREDGSRDAEPVCLAQDAEGQGVGDAGRPFVDRVEGGGRDGDGVGGREWARVAGLRQAERIG